MGLDRVDIRILEQLQRDGRLSLRQLAERLDMSPSTISNRFHSLVTEGVIEGFRPVINYDAIGFDLAAVIEVKADSSQMEDAVAELREMDAVQSLYEVTGATDIVIVSRFRDREHMNAAVKTYQQVDGVRETQTKVVLTSPKEQGTLDLASALQD